MLPLAIYHHWRVICFMTDVKFSSLFLGMLFLLLRHYYRLGQQRFSSSATQVYATRMSNSTIRNNWLQDPSTYPLIACVSGGGYSALLAALLSCGNMLSHSHTRPSPPRIPCRWRVPDFWLPESWDRVYCILQMFKSLPTREVPPCVTGPCTR
jgi:hypothetical protein